MLELDTKITDGDLTQVIGTTDDDIKHNPDLEEEHVATDTESANVRRSDRITTQTERTCIYISTYE